MPKKVKNKLPKHDSYDLIVVSKIEIIFISKNKIVDTPNSVPYFKIDFKFDNRLLFSGLSILTDGETYLRSYASTPHRSIPARRIVKDALRRFIKGDCKLPYLYVAYNEMRPYGTTINKRDLKTLEM